MTLTCRPARREDGPTITEIYNQGIEDRIATFETEPRSVSDIEPWFDHAHASRGRDRVRGPRPAAAAAPFLRLSAPVRHPIVSD